MSNFKLTFKKEGRGVLLFGIPQTNEYQRISQLKINATQKISETPDNQIGLFTLNDVLEKPYLSFIHRGKQINKSIDNRFLLSDYKKINSDSLYIQANKYIDGNDPLIKKIVQEKIGKETNVRKISEIFYQYVLYVLTYGNPIDGLYTFKQAMQDKNTDCGGYATLLMSLFRSLRIPCRLVVGFLINKNFSLYSLFNFQLSTFDSLLMHVWIEILLPDNTWFPLDPSIEWKRKKRLTKRRGGFGEIPSDRLVTSFGEDVSVMINNKKIKVPLLQKPVYLNNF